MFFKTLKKVTRNLLIGGNVATILVMLLVGYSGHLDPEEYTMFASVSLAFPIFLMLNIAFLFFWLIVYPKGAVVAILGLLVNYVPVRTYCPLNLKNKKEAGCIKVMTYNVDVSMKTDTNAQGEVIYPALEYIAASGADIVCVQEAYMTKQKAHALRRFYHYADTTRNEKGGSCLTLFSKFPIVGKEHIRFDDTNSLNTSGAFFLKIQGDTVIVVNNHLESNRLTMEDREGFEQMAEGRKDRDQARSEVKMLAGKLSEAAKVRSPQAKKVARFIREHRRYPIIVCGDFNDNPLSFTRRVIANEGLTDCFITTGNGPGWSFSHNRIYVRIDHILCSKDIIPYECHVDTKIDVSDHYPVSCWLKIWPKSQKINN
ncbi:MAG: endonuclease/exonuclease/phosphatase family protein [Prevotella sp.]|nr:endonuclease/exonuclease/phosphatase family protein [Prevotella sp.]